MWVNFSHAIDESIGGRNEGPYEFVQVTYDQIRVSPDGDAIAFMSPSSRLWYVFGDVNPYTDVTITEI